MLCSVLCYLVADTSRSTLTDTMHQKQQPWSHEKVSLYHRHNRELDKKRRKKGGGGERVLGFAHTVKFDWSDLTGVV